MKRETTLFLASVMAASFVAGGCVTHQRTVVVREPVPATRTVVVTTEPPAPQQEIVGVAPSPEHVWVSGYWTYNHDRWAWKKGHWERRPHREAVWVAGHWDRTAGGWVWRPGHWA